MAKVLIIVDVQNDFCEGGALAVPHSSQIFPHINALKQYKHVFKHVVLTRDWHPPHHVSFASTHQKQPFSSVQVGGKVQELWPEHCVADSFGAQLSPYLQVQPTDIIINKGTDVHADSYSGFAWERNGNELKNLLESSDIQQVYVCGLALDFCVGYTALDAKKYGFKTFVIEEATRAVMKESEQAMRKKLKESQVQIISVSQVPKQ